METGKSMRYPIEYFINGDYAEIVPGVHLDIQPTHTMMVETEKLPEFLEKMGDRFSYFHFFQTAGNFTIFGLSK